VPAKAPWAMLFEVVTFEASSSGDLVAIASHNGYR
jgi:hypothetical protein